MTQNTSHRNWFALHRSWRAARSGQRASFISLLLTLLTVLHAAVATAQSNVFNPEDYVVIRDFGDVRGLAATNAGLFVVTPGAIAAYDTRSRRWLPPVTSVDGLPDGEVIMAIGDPADESIWVGLTSGLVHYLPILREVQLIQTQGAPVRMVFDRDDPFRGLYVATRAGWFFVGRGMGTAVPAPTIPPPERQIRPLSVEEAFARVPGADATRSLALLDEQLRTYRFTAAAWDPMRRVYYFGTNGTGVFEYDPGMGEFEPLPFGLLSDRVGAVIWHNGAVWTGTGGRDGRRGFTRVESNLQDFRLDQGPGAATYRFSTVRDLHIWEGGVWAATDIGVIRVDEPDHAVSTDLPSPSTYALTDSPAGLWVGTGSGLAMLRHFERAGVVVEEVQLTSAPVLALEAEGHDIWIGTSQGLRFLSGTDDAVSDPPPIRGLPIATESITALELHDSRLFVATPNRIMWREPDGTWMEGPPLSATVGAITAIVAASGGSVLWIAGSRGLAAFDHATNGLRTVLSERDLPGSIVGVEVGGGFVWLATSGGLVRLRVGL